MTDKYFRLQFSRFMGTYMYHSFALPWKCIQSRYLPAEHLRLCVFASPKISFCNYNLQRSPSTLTRQQCWQMPFIVVRTKLGRLSGSSLVSDWKAPPGSGLAALCLPCFQHGTQFSFSERGLVKLSASARIPALITVSSPSLSFFIQSGEGIATLGNHWYIFCIRSLVYY